MSKWERVRNQILSGTCDANVSFENLCGLLKRLGFECRIKGSHHVFRKEGVQEHPNLQQAGPDAKPYQVRDIILKHKMGEKI